MLLVRVARFFTPTPLPITMTYHSVLLCRHAYLLPLYKVFLRFTLLNVVGFSRRIGKCQYHARQTANHIARKITHYLAFEVAMSRSAHLHSHHCNAIDLLNATESDYHASPGSILPHFSTYPARF